MTRSQNIILRQHYVEIGIRAFSQFCNKRSALSCGGLRPLNLSFSASAVRGSEVLSLTGLVTLMGIVSDVFSISLTPPFSYVFSTSDLSHQD
jgi:hypothetical protein